MEGACYFADALSIVKTSKKKNINPYDSIKRIFDGEVLFAQLKEQVIALLLGT